MQIKRLLSRMYNWKMESAYSVAQSITGFPQAELDKLKDLSEQFGNCGWQEGKVFDKLRDTNNEIAEALGFIWSEQEDRWLAKF